MSNKSSPLHARFKGLTTRSPALSSVGMPGTPKIAASNLRHKNMSKLNVPDRARRLLKNAEQNSESQLLNTGFSKYSFGSAQRLKPKSTTVNACSTPSSLHRGALSTPSSVLGRNSVNTPQSSRKSASIKTATKSLTCNNLEDNTEISNLTVAVRVRPLNILECARKCVTNVVRVDGTELTVLAGTTADSSAGVTHSFTYDHVFHSCDPESLEYASQQDVFVETTEPLITRAFEGYNACLFAYGQTGSGKSYSMMGVEALDDDALDGGAPHPEAGIIPRFCHELFRRIESVKDTLQAEIEVSYFEIYNEKIHDLLCVAEAAQHTSWGASTPVHRKGLKVREHPNWGPYVVDLSAHPVDSYKALRNWLAVGNSQRATAATGMNDKSSRSHSIFNIVLNITEMSDISSSSSETSLKADAQTRAIQQTRRSKISLVDLAGSERINTSNTNGERIREGVCINKSLLTLGKVIAALADAKKNNGNSTLFVPYRESVLTWLLRVSAFHYFYF
ncbi:kinesin-like protein KIF14 [Teleopsis dalmanni]|uniref:kinesin-like protein KIF14 n=1 Tax=Teleopsis dalmanni TaxID=139649 RepID=UPI0018CCA302|nr:kinesin-like protein KIF14 [Teleopsis dalmanni]